MGDERTFGVDRLDRLTSTDYAETGTTEVSTLDLIGNRESQTNRAGTTTAYGPVNEANEYTDVGGATLEYDEAGNLTIDEDGRQYFYDEHNRLTQIKAADGTVLANYAYDALGRRVMFEDPVAGVTTRYYYDGHSVIEERDGSDTRTRFLVNGAQYIDERIATYADTAPRPVWDRLSSRSEDTGRAAGFTYYLMNQNFSIAGTGNADGSVIERLDYSSGGDFGNGGPAPGPYFFDADDDGDVDLADYAGFYSCFLGPDVDAGVECDLHDWASDYDIDAADFAGLQFCFSGDGGTPPQQCLRSQGPCHAFYFDSDFDKDIDLADHTDLTDCLAGPDVDRIDTCSMHDADADYDVDLADHAGFAECYSGDGLRPPLGCCQPTHYYHDADADGDVDLTDWASFTTCFDPGVEGSPYCVYNHDFDGSHTANGQIDLPDHTGFWECFSTAGRQASSSSRWSKSRREITRAARPRMQLIELAWTPSIHSPSGPPERTANCRSRVVRPRRTPEGRAAHTAQTRGFSEGS